jgi:adenylate cyclase
MTAVTGTIAYPDGCRTDIPKSEHAMLPDQLPVPYQTVAVLFADIVGFTGLAEGLTPQTTIDLLRRYHARMADNVHAHGGTVAQYSGDAIMAIFGEPHAGTHDATNALTCAYGMLATIAHWNAKRRSRGRFPIHIGIGIHTGAVAVGKIGVERHAEQVVVGDTVNVACKLEALTRNLRTPLIVSHELVDAVTNEAQNARLLSQLQAHGLCEVPGRVGRIPIWVLPQGNEDSLMSGTRSSLSKVKLSTSHRRDQKSAHPPRSLSIR